MPSPSQLKSAVLSRMKWINRAKNREETSEGDQGPTRIEDLPDFMHELSPMHDSGRRNTLRIPRMNCVDGDDEALQPGTPQPG